MKCSPNRLTPLYSKIYYKEENYLKVKTVVFKYITPPYSNSQSVLTFLYISHTELDTFSTRVYLIYSPWSVMWLSYPSSYSFTGSINPAFRVLILIQYKFSLSTCTVLYIRSITPTSFFLALFLKIILISKFLIRGVLCPNLI